MSCRVRLLMENHEEIRVPAVHYIIGRFIPCLIVQRRCIFSVPHRAPAPDIIGLEIAMSHHAQIRVDAGNSTSGMPGHAFQLAERTLSTSNRTTNFR